MKFINILLFQLSWWGFVLAAKDQSRVWILIAIFSTLVSFGILLREARRGVKLENSFSRVLLKVFQVLLFALLGFGLDVAMASQSVLKFFSSEGGAIENYPSWLLGLWLAFTISLSLNGKIYLPSRKFSYFLFGIGGPVSYYACQKLGLVQFSQNLLSSFSIMIAVWLVQVELWMRFLKPGQEKY